MDKISNITKTLFANRREVWTVEWYIALDGVFTYNTDTYDTYIERSYKALQKKQEFQYHLLALCASIEEAHELIEMFKEHLKTNDVFPPRPDPDDIQ